MFWFVFWAMYFTELFYLATLFAIFLFFRRKNKINEPTTITPMPANVFK